jgi:hypothetical protein
MIIQGNSKRRTQVVLCECRFKPDLRASGKLTFVATLMERDESVLGKLGTCYSTYMSRAAEANWSRENGGTAGSGGDDMQVGVFCN